VGAAGRLSLAGFSATAVTFGPARNGYGLVLPDIQDAFGLSTKVLGFVASGLYAGYPAAPLAVGLLAALTGPRLPVLAGLLSVGVGRALVALSPNPAVLAAGALAGTGAGWSWAPYNGAVGRRVPASSRDRVLSVTSTGTTFSIAIAGLAALGAAAYGLPWRAAWFAFAAGSLAVAALNAALLPRGPANTGETKTPVDPVSGGSGARHLPRSSASRSPSGWSTRCTGRLPSTWSLAWSARRRPRGRCST
jgi:MFS family permease